LLVGLLTSIPLYITLSTYPPLRFCSVVNDTAATVWTPNFTVFPLFSLTELTQSL